MWGLDSISNFFKAIESYFNCKATSISNQSVTNVIQDKKGNEKALVYAVQALDIANRFGVFRTLDRKRFDYFFKKFNKEIAKS